MIIRLIVKFQSNFSSKNSHVIAKQRVVFWLLAMQFFNLTFTLLRIDFKMFAHVWPFYIFVGQIGFE